MAKKVTAPKASAPVVVVVKPGLWSRVTSVISKCVAAVKGAITRTSRATTAVKTFVLKKYRTLGWWTVGGLIVASLAAPSVASTLIGYACLVAGLLVLLAVATAAGYYRTLSDGLAEVDSGVWRDVDAAALVMGVILVGVIVPATVIALAMIAAGLAGLTVVGITLRSPALVQGD